MYTVKDIAIKLKVCERTIQNLIKRGELPAHKLGRIWRITKEDFEQYLNNLKKN